MASDRRFAVCKASDLRPGERLIVSLGGRSVGVFNVQGSYYALHNRCPHSGGALCEGLITGTNLPTHDYTFNYGREGEILRCGWHGWEFEIATGHALADPRYRAKMYPVTVEGEDVVVHF